MRSTRMRLHIGASRLHRWLALIIGVQLLLWFTSGLVMSLLPIERVRGEHLVEREDGGVLPAQAYAPLDRIAAGTPLRSARHRLLLGRPVVEIETASGELRLHDAATGDRLPAIDATTASRIASAAYRGRPALAVAVARVTTGSTELRADCRRGRPHSPMARRRGSTSTMPGASPPSAPGHGGSTTSSGRSTSWTGASTRTSTRHG